MRPAAHFTLHAILAACLAALAASSAAAMEAARFSITIDGYEIDSGGASIKRQEFDITGYRFGPTRAAGGGWAKADGLDVTWDIPEPRSAYYAPANTKYSNVKLGRAADSAAPTGGVTVGAGDINNAPAGGAGRVSGLASDPAEPASGLPTGKRMHKPVVLSHPLDRGSVMVRGSFPGCAVGKRYAGAQFAGGGMQYDLQDVVVAHCGAGVATLNYAKVKVRGWDPERKEE